MGKLVMSHCVFPANDIESIRVIYIFGEKTLGIRWI